MQKISKITMGVMAGKSLGRVAEATLICFTANKAIKDIFDKDFLEEIKVVSFKDGALYFSAKNTHCIQEVKMREGEIVSKVNKLLENKMVEKVRFKVGKASEY